MFKWKMGRKKTNYVKKKLKIEKWEKIKNRKRLKEDNIPKNGLHTI